ncbi:MAG: aspartate:alanine exchanger family transporter [Phocaeicola sp.]
MLTDLLNFSYFSLFLIVALGFMLGRIKIKGLSLDVSAVIFIALLFGHFGVIIPKELGNFGLVLFIFTIGIQAGPGFFDSFRSKGKVLIVITMLIIFSAAITGVGMKYLFDVDTPSIVGLIAGALTSTPGLAVAIDSTNSPLASISYGIAYPFGVIGVILFVKLLPKIMRVDLEKEARKLEGERRGKFPELATCIFRVTNPVVCGKSLAEVNVRAMTGVVVSRIKHKDNILMPIATTVLYEGDYIQGVGSEDALNQLALLVGEREEGELPLCQTQEVESLLLTKKEMINKQLGDLNLQRNFGCTVTRIRRSGIDLSPSPELELKFGDKLTVVGEREGIKGVGRLLGNDAKKLSDTDFFPIAMGIVLGVLFGKLNISFPGGLSFSPGLTGGVLIVALILSAIGKTGPIMWSMSGAANQLLRQLGLLLFLAEVGTSAGKTLVATFQESGLLLFGIGAAITIIPMLVAVLVGRLVLKISVLDLLGTITGGMTSTPGLAAADSMTDSNIPGVAYATVYPIAMVFLILSIQIIAMFVY